MKQQLIADIQQRMLSTLNNEQLIKLTETLEEVFRDVTMLIDKSPSYSEKNDALESFVSAKRIEGCSEKTLKYYQKTIQTAFKEALDALAANEATRGIFDSYQDQTNSMRRSYEITQKQERSGLIGVTDLLSVEENLLSAEMNLSTARRNELSAVVNLAKALGGGWKE